MYRKSDTRIIGEDGKISKITHKISELRTRKAWHQGTTQNSHTGHCTHTAKSANVKHKRANAGTRDRGTINDDRIAATMYSLETWFVSGICVDTLHKGENNDDDNYKTYFMGKITSHVAQIVNTEQLQHYIA